MTDKINLKVNIAGVEFKNPIIAASGTFGFGREYNEFYDVSVLGGIATKGITLLPREGNYGTRIAETPSGILNSVGLQNPGVEKFIASDLPYLSQRDTVVIANIAGSTEQDYMNLAARLSGTAVPMLELNISCPNVKEGGIAFGILPSGVERITRAVKAASGAKPLIVKLSPNVACIADNARAAENGGADAISLINTVTGMAVNYKTRRPVLGNVTGGLSGPAIKPIALRMVHEAYKAVKIPIIGMGGIMTAEDVLEFIIAGARAVQVGSANLFDPLSAFKLVKALTTLMKTCKINDINEWTGSLITE